MAVAYFGAGETKRLALPAQLIEQADVGGRVHAAYESWAVPTAAISVNSTVDMMILPAGARVIGVLISSPDQGTTGLVTLGYKANGVDSADAAGFLTTVDVKTAAIFQSSDALVLKRGGMLKKFSVQTQVQLKITEAFDVGTGSIEVVVNYILD